MLEHLRERAANAMKQARTVYLSTCGPAGIQSDSLPVRVLDRCLYLLVPHTSDQLLNLEHHPDVLVTTPAWQLRGRANSLAEGETPAALQGERLPEAAWSVWVVVTPLRLTLFDSEKKWFETIDFE